MILKLQLVFVGTMTLLYPGRAQYILQRMNAIEKRLQNMESLIWSVQNLIWGKYWYLRGYMGCYEDDSSRFLDAYTTNDSGMTVDKCLKLCRNRGYKYAGLQCAEHCFCGSRMKFERKKPESDCQTPCSGNKSQICGGTWRMSTYSLI